MSRALQARQELYPEGHSLVAESLRRLGSVAYDQGRYERAEDLYREALSLLRALSSADVTKLAGYRNTGGPNQPTGALPVACASVSMEL